MIDCKSDVELDLMREAGRIVALTHKELQQAVRPGITTKEIDQIADDFIRKQGALPSFKGYLGYPASTICASVNEEIVHGIPSDRGYQSGSASTWGVGQVSETARKLLDVTEQSQMRLDQAGAGNRLSGIGRAVQTYVEAHGFSVVRECAGHGIGQQMHEDPSIPN
jgi:methionyl aminopeptidase